MEGMVWMTLMKPIKSRSERKEYYKSSLKSRKRKKWRCLTSRGRRMKKCCLSKETTLVFSKKSKACVKSWRNLEPNTKVLSKKSMIWLKSISSKNQSCSTLFVVRKRLLSLVIKSWISYLQKTNYISFTINPGGTMKEEIGLYRYSHSTQRIKKYRSLL